MRRTDSTLDHLLSFAVMSSVSSKGSSHSDRAGVVISGDCCRDLWAFVWWRSRPKFYESPGLRGGGWGGGWGGEIRVYTMGKTEIERLKM